VPFPVYFSVSLLSFTLVDLGVVEDELAPIAPNRSGIEQSVNLSSSSRRSRRDTVLRTPGFYLFWWSLLTCGGWNNDIKSFLD
jgi:hypothetical protein